MVFCGLFPTDADDFNDLREALGRLQLNDAALSYEPEVVPIPSSSIVIACHRSTPGLLSPPPPPPPPPLFCGPARM